jgi:hypothetical protein
MAEARLQNIEKLYPESDELRLLYLSTDKCAIKIKKNWPGYFGGHTIYIQSCILLDYQITYLLPSVIFY